MMNILSNLQVVRSMPRWLLCGWLLCDLTACQFNPRSYYLAPSLPYTLLPPSQFNDAIPASNSYEVAVEIKKNHSLTERFNALLQSELLSTSEPTHPTWRVALLTPLGQRLAIVQDNGLSVTSEIAPGSKIEGPWLLGLLQMAWLGEREIQQGQGEVDWRLTSQHNALCTLPTRLVKNSAQIDEVLLRVSCGEGDGKSDLAVDNTLSLRPARRRLLIEIPVADVVIRLNPLPDQVPE